MTVALIVFAKLPEAGRVKTRLIPTLGAVGAAALYDAMLRDALGQYAALSNAPEIRLYLATDLPDNALASAVASLALPEAVTVHRQQGDGLGERMALAFAETFVAGAAGAVVIGTDHPSLPEHYLAAALRAVRSPNPTVVLGPSDDGGYYLLGLQPGHPDLFSGRTYSHPEVYREALRRLGPALVELVPLPVWYDVDDGVALARLRRDLLDPAVSARAPRTAAWLSAWQG